MSASNSCEGKKTPVGSRPRLPAAAERNNFRDVHRRAGQQLLSLTGESSREGGGSGRVVTIISRLFEFEKLAKRPDGARRRSLVGGGRGKQSSNPAGVCPCA